MNIFHFIYKELNFKGVWRLIALLCFVFIQFNLSAQIGNDSTVKKSNDSLKVNNVIKGGDSSKVNNNRVKGSDSSKVNNRVKTVDSTKGNNTTRANRVKIGDKPKNDIAKANTNVQKNDFNNDNSNENSNDIAPRPKKSYPTIIKKLSDLGLPQSMITRIRNLNKRDMDSIHGEDYYNNVRDDNKVEYVIKIMLRFVDGRIIGFIKKEPMMHSNQGEYYQSEVDIPIEWCGLDSLKQEHCVKSMEEMAALDSIISIKPEDWHQKPDPGDINADFASNANLRLIGDKKGRNKHNKEEDLNDSTIAAITNGLSGADSVNAIRDYVLNSGKKGKNKRRTEELSDSTIATITKGLTGLDSLNAIKDYLTYGSKSKKHPKKNRDDEIGIDISKAGSSSADSTKVIKIPTIQQKSKKNDKKKRPEDALDDSTIATITKGLLGEDSMNAIREYIIDAKHSKNQKKAPKKEVVAPVNDTSAAPANQDKQLAPVNNKKDKKKKGNPEHVIPDIRSEEVPVKPVIADTTQKSIDIKKTENALPPVIKDSTTVVKPDEPQVINGRRRMKAVPALPKTDSVLNKLKTDSLIKAAGDSTKQK